MLISRIKTRICQKSKAKIRGISGGNRGKKEEEKRRLKLEAPSTIYHSPITNHQALAGENRGIYGLNQDTSGTNHNNPDHNHHDPVITPEQASKILAVLAENEDKK